jgi:hypothetical protein
MRSVYTTVCGVALVKVVPGGGPLLRRPDADFLGFSGGHILTHPPGDIEFTVGDLTHRAEPLDQIFVPAFTRHTYENYGTEPGCYLSLNLRRREWPIRAFWSDGSVQNYPFRLSVIDNVYS